MATCKECLHVGVCSGFMPSDLDKDVWELCAQGKSDEIPDIEKRCSDFKEVVHCKDCAVKRAVQRRGGIVWRCPHRTNDVDMNGFCENGARMKLQKEEQ